MLFKVNPSKQNIQTEQGALTGSRYVQLHAPQQRRWKVLISNRKRKKKKQRWRRFFGGEFKPSRSTRDPFERKREKQRKRPVTKTAWHQSPNKSRFRTWHWANDAGMPQEDLSNKMWIWRKIKKWEWLCFVVFRLNNSALCWIHTQSSTNLKNMRWMCNVSGSVFPRAKWSFTFMDCWQEKFASVGFGKRGGWKYC